MWTANKIFLWDFNNCISYDQAHFLYNVHIKILHKCVFRKVDPSVLEYIKLTVFNFNLSVGVESLSQHIV